MTQFIKSNICVSLLALVAVVFGFALLNLESIVLRVFTMEPWFPFGYLGDILVWGLFLVNALVVAFIAYKLGFKEHVQKHSVKKSAD